MGTLGYSTGNWIREKVNWILLGYTGVSTRKINVENNIEEDVGKKIDKVIIKYSPASPLIKVDVILNNSEVVPMVNDTTLFANFNIGFSC